MPGKNLFVDSDDRVGRYKNRELRITTKCVELGTEFSIRIRNTRFVGVLGSSVGRRLRPLRERRDSDARGRLASAVGKCRTMGFGDDETKRRGMTGSLFFFFLPFDIA